MDVTLYLQRIGLSQINGAVNLEMLEQLQQQHMLHVPFENLDVIQHVPIPLDVETYFTKIVLNNRGGFCYELNGLFNWLLKSLDFQTYFVSGTINRGDGTWAKEGSHAAQIVQLDQPYLVDVGFGDSTRVPIPLTGETREDVSGVYRDSKVRENIFDLQRKTNGEEWQTQYRFDTTPRQLTDFDEVSHFNQTSPESHFTQKEIVTRATPNGRITLSGDTLKVTRNGKKQETPIHNRDERDAVLKNDFGIYPED